MIYLVIYKFDTTIVKNCSSNIHIASFQGGRESFTGYRCDRAGEAYITVSVEDYPDESVTYNFTIKEVTG